MPLSIKIKDLDSTMHGMFLCRVNSYMACNSIYESGAARFTIKQGKHIRFSA